jgi:L-gulonolactone oxidase
MSGVCEAGKIMNSVLMFRDGEGTPFIEKATIPTNFAMLAPECSPKCIFEPRFMGNFIEDVEFTIKMSQLEDWVKDVKLIVKSELAEIQARLDERYGKGKVTR